MMSPFQAIAAAVSLTMVSPVAQEQPQPEPTPIQEQGVADLGEIMVTGQGLQQQVQSFVRDATAPPPGRALARWDRSICVGVANLDARYAQFMIDRIATIAADIGLDGDDPGCKPNIMVIAASDAGALARALVADDPRGFRPARNATDLGSAALERFQFTDAPVRWWHVSLPVTADTGELAVGLDGEVMVGRDGPEPLQVAVRDASRLRANIRDDLARVIVIIDVSRIGRIGFGALSDYVAMIALAQVRPDADTSPYDTVLNLFSEQADHSAGLTQWDRDYLAALYAARRDRARTTRQTQDIVRGMTSEREARTDD